MNHPATDFPSMHADTIETAARALVTCAGPQDWSRPIAALRDVFARVLPRSERLPPELLNAVFDSNDDVLLAALTGNAGLRADGDLRRRLAATGHPAVARAAGRDFDLLREVLTNARADLPGWHGPDGTIAYLAGSYPLAKRRTYVHSPFPELIRLALDHQVTELSEREMAHGLHHLHRHESAGAARTYAASCGDVVAAKVTAALDVGTDLSCVVAWAEGTEAAIRELRDAKLPERIWLATRRSTLDWLAVDAAHLAEPFDETAAEALVQRTDCPLETVTVLYETHPAVVAAHAHDVDGRLWDTKRTGTASVQAKTTRILMARFLADGDTDELLAKAHPAVAVLETLRANRAKYPKSVQRIRSELTGLVTEVVGADPGAWRVLRTTLKTAKGSVTELFATVRTKLADGHRIPTDWPEKADAPQDGKPTTVSGVRAAFLALFDLATADVKLALLPLLDDRTRYDVLTQGAWCPQWLDLAIADDDRTWLRILAGRTTLGAEDIQRLLERDDPELNARLFGRTNTTTTQRRAILSGQRFGVGDGPVPLDPGLRKSLLAKTGGWRGTDAIDCADRDLQLHILRHVRVRGDRPQLRLLLGAWDRHGPEFAATLALGEIRPVNYDRNPFQKTAKDTVRKLMALADPTERLAELRAKASAADTAAWQLAEMRRERSDHVDFMKHSHHWQWPEILAAHQADPFTGWMLIALAGAPGCPEEIQRDGSRTPEPVADAPRDSETAAGLLRDYPLDGPYRNSSWLGNALTAGQVSAELLLKLGHPAAIAAAQANVILATHPEPLSALIRDTIGGESDAWILALRMLPDFHGTVPELLATAAAATR